MQAFYHLVFCWVQSDQYSFRIPKQNAFPLKNQPIDCSLRALQSTLFLFSSLYFDLLTSNWYPLKCFLECFWFACKYENMLSHLCISFSGSAVSLLSLFIITVVYDRVPAWFCLNNLYSLAYPSQILLSGAEVLRVATATRFVEGWRGHWVKMVAWEQGQWGKYIWQATWILSFIDF